MTNETADPRSVALDTYIARRVAQGFRVETRSGAQAVITRRRLLYFVLPSFVRGLAEQRYVVSVDQQGEVASLAVAPARR